MKNLIKNIQIGMCYNCSICLGAMVPDLKQQVIMLQCGHAFHVLCILGWLM